MKIEKSLLSGSTPLLVLALLKNEIRTHKVGDQLKVQVYRNKVLTEVTVTLTEYVPTEAD